MSKLAGVVLLEGPDGAGKTTLAEHLCKKFDGHYVHRTWRKGMDVWDHHTEALQIANARSHEQLVVIDRLWPSESIYGRVYRQGSEYGYNARAMDRVLLRLGAITVACVPRDVDYVERTHAARASSGGEMYSTVRAVAQRYVSWLDGDAQFDLSGDYVEQQTALEGILDLRPEDTLHYDVTVHGSRLDNFAELIEFYVEDRRNLQWNFALDPNTPNVLGYKNEATHLFVGEQVGDLHAWSRWPFYARSHSPEYLNRCLHQIAWPEHRGAWTNAWDEDNRLPHIYNASPKLRVVALGRKAERRCKALGIPVHASVPHPSWARRFNHHGERGTPYHKLLEQALS